MGCVESDASVPLGLSSQLTRVKFACEIKKEKLTQ